MMNRRKFIQRLASTGIVLPLALGYPRVRAFAKSPAGSPFMRLTSAMNDHVMILIRLAGGNDGLNTVVPYNNETYYKARKRGVVGEDLSIAAEQVAKFSDSTTLGLHPGLAPLMALYNEKKMAVVQNVGYPNQNLSHFRSTDIWLSGSDWNVYDNAGWYAKYLEERYPDYPSVVPRDPFAIELGTYLSTTLIGENNNMGIAVSDLSFIPGQPDTDPVRSTNAGIEEEYVRQIARQSNLFSNSILDAFAKSPTNRVTYPGATNILALGLSAIARLIAGGLGTQMYIINVGGYDTHTGQLALQNTLHSNMAGAVLAFQRDMEAFGLDQRVSLMTISEFGRRAYSNGTGTDHGSAAPMFVFGSGVKGGIIGRDPNLEDLEGAGNIKMQHDFRQVYASVLGQWFGAPEEEITPVALPRHFDQLPIFKVTPSSVDDRDVAAASVRLGQNYPNPASDGTIIPVEGISAIADARLMVYDAQGKVLISERLAPGQTSVEIGTRGLPSGTYMYELVAAGKRMQRKMTVRH